MKNTIIRKEDKIYAGLPYLYRASGLPSEVYEVRFKQDIDGGSLEKAIADTLERYPYFGVKFREEKGDFYAVTNELPLKAFNNDKLISLGGAANNYHLMGVNFFGNKLWISFHHGLTDGRGAKSFLEAVVNYYADYADSPDDAEAVYARHHKKADELSEAEYIDPCENKHKLEGSSGKVEGLECGGFRLPETADKSSHRRYEMRFSQDDFMSVCKKYGASPIVMLTILMSRGIAKLYPDNKKPIISNFPMDARKILGCDESFKNCVKSMSLPYSEKHAEMQTSELSALYKSLLNAQKDHDYCAKEFNNIVMLLSVIGHFHSFVGRQRLLGFMENLSLDTYLISYVGQFDVPEKYVDEVHLYSDCSSGLVMNMTCQSGNFIIDFTEDFETGKYIDALKAEFGSENIPVNVSDEIIFSTPHDNIHEIITSPADTAEQLKGWWENFVESAKKSAAAAKERAAAAQAMSQSIAQKSAANSVLYYDTATGTMKSLDPTKDAGEELKKLVGNTLSVLIS